MTKRKIFYCIINVILVIIFSLSFVMGKIFKNPNTAPSSSYVFGLFVGYLTATVACILDKKLKDDKKE